MEHPALLFAILSQSMRQDAATDSEHDYPVPFPTLDAMHCRERDAVLRRLALKRLPQPSLERRRVRMQIRHLQERLEVVEVARPLPRAGAVEHAHRLTET